MHESRCHEHLLAPCLGSSWRRSQLYDLVLSLADLHITALPAMYETGQPAQWQHSRENDIAVEILPRKTWLQMQKGKRGGPIYRLIELGREVFPYWQRAQERPSQVFGTGQFHSLRQSGLSISSAAKAANTVRVNNQARWNSSRKFSLDAAVLPS